MNEVQIQAQMGHCPRVIKKEWWDGKDKESEIWVTLRVLLGIFHVTLNKLIPALPFLYV